MAFRQRLKWAGSSMGGHVLYWEIVTGIPMFIFAITRPRAGDEQPDGWTFKVFVFCIVLSGLVGMLFWATVMKPRINRQKKPVDSEAK